MGNLRRTLGNHQRRQLLILPVDARVSHKHRMARDQNSQHLQQGVQGRLRGIKTVVGAQLKASARCLEGSV